MNSLKRLKLISAVYDYMAHAPSHLEQDIDTNCNREMPIAWDMYQIVAAIAGDYRIELSPHYKGVQRLRRNKELWNQVSQFVVLRSGHGCLPHDAGELGDRWREMNGIKKGKVKTA